MTRYISTTDDHTYDAASSQELVAMMHAMSGLPGTPTQWMHQAAEGIAIQFGKPVRSGTTDEFVSDLIMIGFIKIAGGK